MESPLPSLGICTPPVSRFRGACDGSCGLVWNLHADPKLAAEKGYRCLSVEFHQPQKMSEDGLAISFTGGDDGLDHLPNAALVE